jgi:hypothetical protein
MRHKLTAASPTLAMKLPWRRRLRVGLVLALGALADAPDVAVRVREGTAVPAPLLGGGGLEDRGAGLLGSKNTETP